MDTKPAVNGSGIEISFEPPDIEKTGAEAGKPLDSETAVLMRGYLLPLFQTSESWPALIEALRGKGFDLVFRNGRLFLAEQKSGVQICPVRFLGISLPELVARIGRPTVLAVRGAGASGVIIDAPSFGTPKD